MGNKLNIQGKRWGTIPNQCIGKVTLPALNLPAGGWKIFVLFDGGLYAVVLTYLLRSDDDFRFVVQYGSCGGQYLILLWRGNLL